MRSLVLAGMLLALFACAPAPAAQTPPPLPTTAASVPPTASPVQPSGQPTLVAPAAILATPTPPAAKPGEYENSIVVGGETRDYILHIPPGYDGSKAVPLVFVLHPYNGSDRTMENSTGMSAKADQENFIAVYPNGTGSPRAWNALFFPVRPSLPDDVAFIRALMDTLLVDNGHYMRHGAAFVVAGAG